MFEKINVLLLAGGKTKTSLRKFTSKEKKALIEIIPQGKPMILQVIDALRKARYLNKIILTGPEEVQRLTKNRVDLTIPEGQTIIDSLKSGIQILPKDPLILISTCDLPLITEKHLDYFIEKCYKFPGLDLYYPIIAKEEYQKSYPFPELRRIYANLAEGSFTGGNIILINPQIITNFEETINQFIYFRKYPLKMARLLGPQIALKYLRRYLSIRDLEKIFSEVFVGFQGKAIPSPPEIALDIDKAMQLEKVREIIAEKNSTKIFL